MALSGFRSFFGDLGASVGNGRQSRPEDVAKVQGAMRDLGRYPTGRDGAPAGVLDRGLDRALRGYQADRRVKQDGWLAPRGETARDRHRPRSPASCQDARADSGDRGKQAAIHREDVRQARLAG